MTIPIGHPYITAVLAQNQTGSNFPKSTVKAYSDRTIVNRCTESYGANKDRAAPLLNATVPLDYGLAQQSSRNISSPAR
jgi:hypothetical protein